ncbi:MAG TPA: 2-succinyl-5-enolpyruvyl-6-hydroxy-3-cyclohexene-1-carboxylic-acid synthase [Acidimicrobiales bacterium]|nr:2-succinyl-5-enolpyruvyl-6-hydroxy-3-cyclohexene-1-carboxylic-acid synthase [Acidimicrobiales bacterium]
MSVQATFSATLVDEWVLSGVTDAVICPGSRSTPIALALAERLRVHIRLDERSAAFYGLGLAMASGRPTVICTTSGTAAAELHPAVLEAHHARVALILCTADRPPELHHVGAPQTIDQDGLFTTATRWACAPGVPVSGQEATWRPLAARAFAEARNGPHGPGPVHLNLAFREPLVGKPGALPDGAGPRSSTIVSAPPSLDQPLSGRGLIIAGAVATQDPAEVRSLGEQLRWPLLADPRSGCRFDGTIAAADAIVRTGPPLPECIVMLGAPWLSKALGAYVSAAAASGARIISVDPWWEWTDPTHAVSEFHHVDADAWVAAAFTDATPGDEQWLSDWSIREQRAQLAIAEVLGNEVSEPLVARMVARHASLTDATIMVAASMPMRDLEWFAPALPAPPPVLSNRGANGIDGVVSTALGVAAAGHRTFALMGDLAFLHDVSGLVNLPDVPCTFVVVDNGGGGIFSFLPQAETLPHGTFEQLFGTPPTTDLGNVGRGFGLDVYEVDSVDELERAFHQEAPALIRVRVPGRAENVALHDKINQAVRLALR